MSFVPSRPAAFACLALSMSLVGSYVALSKPLAAAIPVFLLAWLRFGIGGLAMMHWLRKPANEPPLTPRTRKLLFLESFLGNFLFSICMLFGVSMTSAVSGSARLASKSVPASAYTCMTGEGDSHMSRSMTSGPRVRNTSPAGGSAGGFWRRAQYSERGAWSARRANAWCARTKGR